MRQRFSFRDPTAIEFVLQRSCEGVVCEAGSRCWNEACVPDACTDGTQPECGTDVGGGGVPACDADSDCAAGACGAATCIDGGCFVDAAANDCGAGFVCNLATGCVPEVTVCGDVNECGAFACFDVACESRSCLYSAAALGSECTTESNAAGLCAERVAGQGRVCEASVAQASCVDGIQNQDETDIDCGGGCPACADGLSCGGDVDCISTSCDAGVCVCISHAHCNGGELCLGGRCQSSQLATGATCNFSAQCQSGKCDGGASRGCLAATSSCSDGVQSGTETGVDCGGSCLACSAQSFDCATQTDVPESECVALVDLYESMRGSGWVAIPNWVTGASLCSWGGVTCSGGHVSQLVLRDDNHSGVLAWGLDALTELSHLEIGSANYNSFTRTNLAGAVPGDVRALRQLSYLGLDHHRLTSLAEPTDGAWSMLQEYDLAHNDMTGPIPASLGDLQSLILLRLQHNQLSGTVPPALGQLSNLTTLQIGVNQLTGTLPGTLGNLSQLRVLWADYNRLSGALPDSLSSLSQLADFRICPQQNELTSSSSLGSWLRSITLSDWEADNRC